MTPTDSQFLALIQAAIDLANSIGDDIERAPSGQKVVLSMIAVEKLLAFRKAHDNMSDTLDLFLLDHKKQLQ